MVAMEVLSWARSFLPVFPAFGRLRKRQHEFKASLRYTEIEVNLGYTARPYLEHQENTKRRCVCVCVHTRVYTYILIKERNF